MYNSTWPVFGLPESRSCRYKIDVVKKSCRKNIKLPKQNMSNFVTKQRVANVSLLEYASANRDDGFFSDIKIVAGQESIFANRLVLSCYSKYFEDMFKSQMLERDKNTIEIQTVEGTILTALIDFIYVGAITISNENVMSLLAGADYLQLEEVKQLCCEFLQTTITPHNALGVLRAASLYRSNYLEDQAAEYITKNLDKVTWTNEFKNLSKKDLISCISKLDQSQSVAISIYQAIVTWTKHRQYRKNEFLDLFKMIKLKKTSIDFLEEFVLDEQLVIDNFECQKITLAAYRKLLEDQKNRLKESVLLSLGGDKTPDKITSVYNCQRDETPRHFPHLAQKLIAHCALKLSNYIYAIGGHAVSNNENLNVNANVWRLNLKKRNLNWEEVCPMNEERYVMGAAVYHDAIVVAGGAGGDDETLASVEYYTASLNEWKTISSMNQPRSGSALVASNDYLYAIGGYDGKQNSATVERMKDLNGEWEDVQSMQVPRRWLAAVNCNGVLYAIGGQLGKDIKLQSVEKYQPSLKAWVYVNGMNFRRSAHAACVLRGKIYVVGGLGPDGEVVKEVECFDPAKNRWSIVETINDKLYHHALIAV